MESVEDDANSFLLSLYCWKAYYVWNRNGSLVKQSVATARTFYVVKVGCYSCYLPFLALYRKTLDFSRVLQIISPRTISFSKLFNHHNYSLTVNNTNEGNNDEQPSCCCYCCCCCCYCCCCFSSSSPWLCFIQ